MINQVGNKRASLGGRTVALLEARRASELASLVESYGGVARHAPALREQEATDDAAITAFLDAATRQRPHIVIFQTGVGAQRLHAAIERLGRTAEWLAILDQAVVAVRGPKPTAALREAGIRIDRRAAEPYTTAELLDALAQDELQGKTVALQHYGEPNAELVAALLSRQASVLEVEVYSWQLPEDTGPLERLIRDLPSRQVDVVVATSQAQVRHLFEVAAQLGVTLDLNRDTVVAAVGPVAARAFTDRGVRVDVEPAHPKMGALVNELAKELSR